MSCDPLDTSNRCPGELLCGTDKFCHPEGESSMACIFEQNDAAAAPDAAFRDAPPVDAIPSDAFTMCAGGAWQADFDADPTQAGMHDWLPSDFVFTRDVLDMAWQPRLDREALTTDPATPPTGVTVFQALVSVGAVDSHHVDLHLDAGSASASVLVDIDVSRMSNAQPYTVSVTGQTTKTLGGSLDVNPHLLIGKLDFAGGDFKLFVDSPGSAPVVELTFAPRSAASMRSFTVTADTTTIVDDLGVCAN